MASSTRGAVLLCAVRPCPRGPGAAAPSRLCSRPFPGPALRAASGWGAAWRPEGESGRTPVWCEAPLEPCWAAGTVPPSPLSMSVPCPQSLAGPWAGPSSAWTGSADRSAPTSLGTALRAPSCRSCLKAGLRAGPKPEQPGHSRHAFWVLPEDRPSFPVGPRVLLLAWISRGTHLPYPGSEQIEE